MELTELSQEVSEHLASRTGLHVAVEMRGHTASLRGRIPSAEARTALLHLAAELMPRWQLVDELQVDPTQHGAYARAGEWLWVDVVGE